MPGSILGSHSLLSYLIFIAAALGSKFYCSQLTNEKTKAFSGIPAVSPSLGKGHLLVFGAAPRAHLSLSCPSSRAVQSAS